MNRELVEKAVRDLIAAIYNDCASDGYRYEGDCETEIQNLVTVLVDEK